MPDFAPYEIDGEVVNTIRVRNVSGDRRPMTPTQYAALLNALTDPFAKYLLLAGRSGGQTAIGGTATGEKLILQANSANGSDAEVEVLSTATGATGAQLALYQNSASPAVSDLAGVLSMYAKDANGTKTLINRISAVITETTAGAMSSQLALIALDDGTAREVRFSPDSNAIVPGDDNHWDLGITGTNRFRSAFFSATAQADIVNAVTGFRINGAAASNAFLVGNGTNFVSNTLAYTAYTPTVTQSGTVTSFTTNTARWAQVGKTIFVQGNLLINDAGGATAANIITISLPSNFSFPSSATQVTGSGYLYDSSADILYPFSVRLASATVFTMLPTDQVATAYGAGGLALGTLRFTAALANADQLSFNFSYEAA